VIGFLIIGVLWIVDAIVDTRKRRT